MSESPKARISLPHQPVHVEMLRSQSERDLYDAIKANERITSLRDDIVKEVSPTQFRRGLLRNAMKVTRRMSPSLHYLVDTVVRIIDIGERTIEMFVFPGEFIDAWSTQIPGDDTVYLGLSSTAVEKLSQQELLNILGHELGHVVGHHTDYPINMLLDKGTEVLSVLDVYKLLALSRYRELTADRVGLLCCQDYRVAAGCLLKTSSGVTTGKLRFNLTDYLGQLTEITSLDDVDDTSEDWFASHPFSPLRVKGLELFAQTDVFQKAVRKGEGNLPFPQMEKKMDEFMAIMNPSYLSDTGEKTDEEVREWLTLAGILIALANGVLDPQEVVQISDLIGFETFKERIEELMQMGPNGIMEVLEKKTEPVFVKLPPARRLQLIRDLVLIAFADGSIDEYEFHALFDIARLMEISPAFVEQVAEEIRVEVQMNATQNIEMQKAAEAKHQEDVIRAQADSVTQASLGTVSKEPGLLPPPPPTTQEVTVADGPEIAQVQEPNGLETLTQFGQASPLPPGFDATLPAKPPAPPAAERPGTLEIE